MTMLTEVALVLTHEHHRPKPEGGYAKEPALLDTLRDCVASTTTSKGSGGGGGGRSTPVDLGALDLLRSIENTVGTCWPGNGDPAYVRTPLKIKLNQWVNLTTDPVAEGALLDLCRRWVAQITELLEPTKKVPLPGVECPVCGWDRTLKELDGESTYAPALVAYPELEPVKVRCTVEACSGEWAGPEVAETFFVSGVVNGN